MDLDAQIEELISRYVDNTKAVQGCWIWQGKARTPKPRAPGPRDHDAGRYGRVKLRWPGQLRLIQTTVHRAVYALVNRHPDILGNERSGDVSHLCGTHLCIKPDHLTLENRAANCQRRTCHRRAAACSCQPPCLYRN